MGVRVGGFVKLFARNGSHPEILGQMAGGIAHNFNNLLQVVIGNLDLLKDTTPPGSPELMLIEAAQAAAFTGSDLTNSLLALGDRQTSPRRTIELNEIVTDQINSLRSPIGSNWTLKETSTDHTTFASVDIVQLRCALTELVANARDAMPKGGIIEARCYNTTLTEMDCRVDGGVPPGVYAAVEVADSGVGITPEHIERIFQPFFATKEFGRGMGLSMVLGFVQRMKGAIKVASQIGQGSTFTMLFPEQKPPWGCRASTDADGSPAVAHR